MYLELVDVRGDVHHRLRADGMVLHCPDGAITAPFTSQILTDVSARSWLAGEGLVPLLDCPRQPMDPAEVALLTLVAGTWPEVFDRQTGLAWHATLSYAVPLALDTSWQHWAWGNAAYLASTRQLVLVPASELVAVAPLPLRHDELRHRHRRLLRRHEATRSTAVTLDEVLRWWTHFAPLRHGTDGPPQDRAALATVMRTIGCTGQAWIHDGRAICMSVVCWHAKSRTVFDVLAPWDSAFARLRPGVYSAVSTMLQAAEQGWRYSLCYGTGAYKAEITAGTVPLTLPDLITE